MSPAACVPPSRIAGTAAACIIGWTIAATPAVQVVQAQRSYTAVLGAETVERTLARGEEHRYRLVLTAGEYARVTVEQRGIDVVVQARGPSENLIADAQDEVTNRGEEHVDLVANAAGAYTLVVARALGPAAAGAYAIRLDSRRPATAVDRSLQNARTLRTFAAQRAALDDFAGAATLYERALALTENARGPGNRDAGSIAAELADVYLDWRNPAKAEPMYQRALATLDATVGREHPSPAFARSRLARLYQISGERLKAEALIREGLEVLERTVGTDHVLYVRALVTQQALRENAGDFEQAAQILRRQLEIMDRIGGKGSVLYSHLLSALGGVYNMQRDGRSQAVLHHAFALCVELRGPDSNCAPNPLHNLGVAARNRGDVPAAAAYYQRAFTIAQRFVGADNPDLIPMLNNLANTYNAAGDKERALAMHFQAVGIEERSLGPYHRYALLSTGNIAVINTEMGNIPAAIAFQRRSDEILERQIALNMAVGSERQKLASVRALPDRTDRTISLHLRQAPRDANAESQAALVVLQRKGRVLDAMTDMFAAARLRTADPEGRALLDRLDQTTGQLARVALNAPDSDAVEARVARIRELESEKEQLEAAIGARDAEFRAQTLPVTLVAVQAAIPDQAALVEFVVFRPFNASAEEYRNAYGAPRYAAYVLRHDAAPHGVELGDAAAIDNAIAGLREALRDPSRRDMRQRARAVDELLMAPLRPAIGGAERLLLSPDGDLNLVPFEALIDEWGRYLIERYAITYLSSGRDLLRMQVPRASRSAPIIVADPRFGDPAGGPHPPATRRGVTASGDRSSVYFAPLPATAAEGRAIKQLFPEATLFTGPQATKAALQSAVAPRLLHIASHGFFLRPPGTDGPPPPATTTNDGTRGMRAAADVANPLLRSGLALAGANVMRDADDDGILTALEASRLNLWGTKLVTLSACDTGLGEIRNGEGVYGLRRAFVLAGAETMVISLWPVSDYLTHQMMTAYYTGLRAGLGRGDALRRAKLDMLKRPGRRHPFYWASFIQSGEWATLDGQR